MPERIYLDTNAFRHFGVAFEKAPLASSLADRILISPLSAFEALAQLAEEDGDVVLGQIHAIRHWINPQHSGLSPWPDDMICQLWLNSCLPTTALRKGCRTHSIFASAQIALQPSRKSRAAQAGHGHIQRELCTTFQGNAD